MKSESKWFLLGILLFISGILVAYFGYFVYPEYLLGSAGFGGFAVLFFPLILIFLGFALMYVAVRG